MSAADRGGARNQGGSGGVDAGRADFSLYSLYVSIAWSFVASAREESNSVGVCHVVAVSCWYVWPAKALSRPNRTGAGDAVHVWLLWNWSVN